eukprot:gene6117-6356_t
MSSHDIEWERLDKTKFFVVGIGLFSGVTTALFPLSVIKTRQMAAHSHVPAGIAGSRYIARHIWKDEGIRGFYRGFGTVVFGTIPARTIYLTSLEVTKSATTKLGEQLGFSPTAVASIASAAGGAAASLSTQAVVVPIDVQLRGLSSPAGPAAVPRMNGFQMACLIVQQEGVGGLYRGFWPSVATFVPNSAIWWGAYGFWQRLIWEQLPSHMKLTAVGDGQSSPSTSAAVAVETVAGVLSGCTSALITNPLDLVAQPDASGAVPSVRQVLKELLAEEGARGLLRGVAPRMASSACWGTAMDSRLAPLQQYWHHLVALLQPQLSADFSPSLVFYGPGELLPSGAPGDPALEYNKNRRASCGLFTSGFSAPYAVCPTSPGGLPSSDLARDCCRHLAYCVPRSRFALAALDRQSSVVASPRLAAAADQTWQGVLVHEMGHCIDFWTFPERYRLPALLQPPTATAAAALALIDEEELDAEIRADRMANALLGHELGAKLCYNMATHVQELVESTTRCLTADEEKQLVLEDGQTSSEAVFTTHFPHPPVSAG